jgi:thiol-disulfide isomerase/thioredoxin
MFCIIAFVVLAILGIFSASNRELAKEALDCVLRRVTLRPCNTGFDEKMKAKILGVVITRSETAAMVLNKNFEVFSWVFFVMMLGSSIWTVRGFYLFYTTGSCNGLNSSAFCVFDPTGKNNQVTNISNSCKITPTTEAGVSLTGVSLAKMPVLDLGGADKVVFVGCYHCDYSRLAYPMIWDLVNKFKVNFTFFNYPVKEPTDYFTKLSTCAYQQDQDKFWKFNDVLFSGEKTNLDNDAYIQKTLVDNGYDPGKIKACVNAPETETLVKSQMSEVMKTGFYGTPTVFINGKAMIGPKPYRVYAINLKGLFYWLR